MWLERLASLVDIDEITFAKAVLPVLLFAAFWIWETWQPFFGRRKSRLVHAGRNLTIAIVNTVILALVFGTLTATTATWTEQNRYGLLNNVNLPYWLHFVAALIVLDAWMYVWHRANHVVPLLWRFHRMHHSDRQMDVTTATRFHLGEHTAASVLRLGLIPLIGFEIWNLVVYDAMVIAVTQFHHADISLGRWDRPLRWFLVTPDMHKVHHSDQRPETDSNYSVVLSVWDRLARSFRIRRDAKTIVFGLTEYTDPGWQSIVGMLKTPFTNPISMPESTQVNEPPSENGERPKRILFVCNENSNRSQMAEAFARRLGNGRLEVYSAGAHPSGRVHPKAVDSMQELGYDLSRHQSKGLSQLPQVTFDLVVTMGCNDQCNVINARQRENWNIPVPKEMPPEQFRMVRDGIEEGVKELLERLELDVSEQ